MPHLCSLTQHHANPCCSCPCLGAAHSRTLAISSVARLQKIRKQPKRIKLNTPYVIEQLDAEMQAMELKSSSAFSSPDKSQGVSNMAANRGFGSGTTTKPMASGFANNSGQATQASAFASAFAKPGGNSGNAANPSSTQK